MAASTLTMSLETSMLECEGVGEVIREKDIPRSLLTEIASRIREHFPGCPISLSVSLDWEGTNYNFLVMHAHVPYDPHDALTKLHEFDQAYWLDTEERTRD